jgi:CRISPR-associated endoribonuclease Cas6
MPFLHEVGFRNGGKRFRHLTFSRIFSTGMKKEGNYFLIINPIEFYASFFVDPMPNIVIEHLINNQYLRLGNEEYEIIDVKAFADPFDFAPSKKMELDIETLSPIVTYKTIYIEDKKKTQYFKPYDAEFPKTIAENLKNKLSTIHDADPEHLEFHIAPTRFDLKRNESIIRFKGFIIKGYMGKFHISGSSELVYTAYHTGLGSKNAQGFGMFKIVD